MGQVIRYTYTVTNTSPSDGFTLHDITVHDDQLSEITNCTPRTLAPGESATCTATHRITQDDLNAGNIVNTAVATGETPNDDTATSPPDEAIVTALQNAAIRITKVARPQTYDAPGQMITYRYTVRNIGNVTLRDVAVTDTRYGRITCPKTTLAPRASMTCHTAHVITAVDLSEGSIFNSSRAVGHPPTGDSVKSPPAHAIVTGVLAKPELPQVPVTG